MGGQVSKTQTSTDIATSITNEVTTNVINSYTTVVGGKQSIDLSCTDAAITVCSNNCAHAGETYAKLLGDMVAAKSITATDMAALQASYNPPACQCCLAENVNEEITISITSQDISDNSIAGKIQAGIQDKINSTMENAQSGTIGYSQSQKDALTRIKTTVDTKFDTNIINSTLRSFNFDQNITGQNMTMKNISQKSVANCLATSLVQSMVSNDASTQSDLDALFSDKTTQSGAADNLTDVAKSAISAVQSMVLGAEMMYIVIIIVIFAILYGLFKTLLGGGGSSSAPQYPQSMNPMQPPYPQSMNPMQPPQYPQSMNPMQPPQYPRQPPQYQQQQALSRIGQQARASINQFGNQIGQQASASLSRLGQQAMNRFNPAQLSAMASRFGNRVGVNLT